MPIIPEPSYIVVNSSRTIKIEHKTIIVDTDAASTHIELTFPAIGSGLGQAFSEHQKIIRIIGSKAPIYNVILKPDPVTTNKIENAASLTIGENNVAYTIESNGDSINGNWFIISMYKESLV